MADKKPLTPQERTWLTSATDPQKLQRALRVQYFLVILLFATILAGLVVYGLYPDWENVFWLVLFAIQLLVQLFNIRINRQLLKERKRLEQQNENSK